MIRILVALIIIALVTVFSVQNASPVTITFIYWEFKASLAIVVFLSVLAGVLVGIIAMAAGRLRRSSRKQVKKRDEHPETETDAAGKP